MEILKKLYELTPVSLQNILLQKFAVSLYKERYGGKFSHYRDLLTKTQWYSVNEMVEYQNNKLKHLVSHAYHTVPYYKKAFDNLKLKPNDIKTKNDLTKIPLLTKSIIKNNFKNLISRNFKIKNLKPGKTSGTTGSPLKLLYDLESIQMTYAVLNRVYDWAGCKFSHGGDRVGVFRGNKIVKTEQKKPPFWRYNKFQNQLLFSAFHMSGMNLFSYYKELQKFSPMFIDGYPSTIYIMAKFLESNNITLPLKAVITSSETLYNYQRDVIEKVFQCKIFDYYALAERVIFASECQEHDGVHLFEEYGITELLDKNNFPIESGKVGNMVGTSLNNYGMPLIRYATNDFAAIKTEVCKCGRSLPRMHNISGKLTDMLKLKDGRIISPTVLEHPFKPIQSIEASQIIQEDYDQILVKIVRGEKYKNKDTERLLAELKGRLGKEINIEIEFHNDLPRTANGKLRWVVSKVKVEM